MNTNPSGQRYAFNGFYSSSGVYFVYKFKEHFVQAGTNSTTGFPYTIVPLLTAEEVLFNRAEAYVMQNNFTASLDDLNTWISTRVVNYVSTDGLWMEKLFDYYPDKKTSRDVVLAAILDFKRIEFVHEGQRLPASYANFYIANTAVIVPTYRCANDDKALQIIQQGFPERKVIGIDSTDIIWGLGSFHCLSQQDACIFAPGALWVLLQQLVKCLAAFSCLGLLVQRIGHPVKSGIDVLVVWISGYELTEPLLSLGPVLIRDEIAPTAKHGRGGIIPTLLGQLIRVTTASCALLSCGNADDSRNSHEANCQCGAKHPVTIFVHSDSLPHLHLPHIHSVKFSLNNRSAQQQSQSSVPAP